MKKYLLLILLSCIGAFTVSAQKKMRPDKPKPKPEPHLPVKLSIGADIGLPTGDAGKVYSLAAGVSAKLELPFYPSKALNFVMSAGYSTFIAKSAYSGTLANAAYIPLEMGLKYYVAPQFYLEGDVGASINVNSNYTGPAVALIYAPGIGFSFPTSAGNAIDLGLRYEGRAEAGGTVSQAALRIAYKFSLTHPKQ